MRPGTVLTLVIVALALTGVAMFVLTEGSNAMLFHADTAYLQAIERNLITSGLAWARQKISDGLPGESAGANDDSSLPVAAFGVPDAQLQVRVLDVQNDRARVHIETSCCKGRRTLHTARDYTIRRGSPHAPIGSGTPLP